MAKAQAKHLQAFMEVPIVNGDGEATGVSLGELLMSAGEQVSLNLRTNNHGQLQILAVESVSPTKRSRGRPRKEAEVSKEIKPVRKTSRVYEMLKMLNRQHGATFAEIKKKFDWTDGGVSSYLHYEPGQRGYGVEKIQRSSGDTAYKLKFPEGVNEIAVSA